VLDPREPEDREPRGKPRRAGLAVLGIPAVAVIVALALRWSTPMGGLVSYELEIIAPKTPARGAAQTDDAAPSPLTLEPGQRLTLLLRPERPSEDPVEARLFVDAGAGSLRREPVPFATEAVPGSPGALRIGLDAHRLPARGRVVVLIGRPGSVPGAPAGTATHGRNWQRFDIDFEQPGPSAR